MKNGKILREAKENRFYEKINIVESCKIIVKSCIKFVWMKQFCHEAFIDFYQYLCKL